MFSVGFVAGDLGGSGNKERFCGIRQLAGGMPADLVEHHDRMCLYHKMARDFIKVMLQCFRVGVRHGRGRPS